MAKAVSGMEMIEEEERQQMGEQGCEYSQQARSMTGLINQEIQEIQDGQCDLWAIDQRFHPVGQNHDRV